MSKPKKRKVKHARDLQGDEVVDLPTILGTGEILSLGKQGWVQAALLNAVTAGKL